MGVTGMDAGRGERVWDTQGVSLQPWLRFLGVRQGRAPRLELQPSGAVAEPLHRAQAEQSRDSESSWECPGECTGHKIQKAFQEGQKWNRGADR